MCVYVSILCMTHVCSRDWHSLPKDEDNSINRVGGGEWNLSFLSFLKAYKCTLLFCSQCYACKCARMRIFIFKSQHAFLCASTPVSSVKIDHFSDSWLEYSKISTKMSTITAFMPVKSQVLFPDSDFLCAALKQSRLFWDYRLSMFHVWE